MSQENRLTSGQTSTLQVDFQWRKLAAKITELENPDKIIYTVDCSNVFKGPNMVFKRADGEIFGESTLHAVSIDANYKLEGREGLLKAAKRLKTEYTHLSYNFSASESPVTMYWKTTADMKNWDFVCLDEQQIPIARLNSNLWYLKKVGNIEFLGPKAIDRAAREEIIVVGLTLYNNMLLRVNNPLQLIGALTSAKPGPIKNDSVAVEPENDPV